MSPQQLRAESRWALVNLGLRPQEFFQYTPAEWGDIVRLWCERERREDRRLALLALHFANASGAKRKDNRPLTLDDFLPPDPMKKQPKKRKRYKQEDLIYQQFMAATAGHQHIYTNGNQQGSR